MAISVVQQQFVDSSAFTTSITATFSNPTSAGSIIVAVGWAKSVSTALVFSDNKGDTPTDCGLGSFEDVSSSFYTAISAFFSPTTGTTTVTVSYSSANPSALQIYEVSGFSSASWDTKNSNTGYVNDSSQSVATGTLAQAAEFIAIVGSGTNGAATTSSLTASPGSFVFDNEFDHGGTGGQNLQTGHMITSATSSVTATISTTGFSGLESLIASIKGTLSTSGPSSGPVFSDFAQVGYDSIILG